MAKAQIRTIGTDGLLVSFGAALSEPANRAALSFRTAVEAADWDGLLETATSLVSTYLRFDPLRVDHATLHAKAEALLAETDWTKSALPEGRRLWRVPTVFGTDLAPQLEDAAALAGVTAQEAIDQIARSPVRVQTIGFAPGMPYLGALPDNWDIPRQKTLTDQVPAGGLCVAIRQLVMFPVGTPTGWRHIGQTAFTLFQPDAPTPFLLRPGDEVLFTPTARDTLTNLQAAPQGGATCEVLQ